MPIGTSLGGYFEDETAFHSAPFYNADSEHPDVLVPTWQSSKDNIERDATEEQDMRTLLPPKVMKVSDSDKPPSLLQSFGTMAGKVLNEDVPVHQLEMGPVPFRNSANDASQSATNRAVSRVQDQQSNIGPDTTTRFNPTDRVLELIDRSLNSGSLAAQARAGRRPAEIGVEPVNRSSISFEQEPLITQPRIDINNRVRDNLSRVDREDQDMIANAKILAEKGNIKLKDITKEQGVTNPVRHVFGFENDEGRRGILDLHEREDGKLLYVNWIGGLSGVGGLRDINEFGKKDIRDLLSLVRDNFPSAERIAGFRVSGARAATGRGSDRAEMQLRKPAAQPQRKSIEEMQQLWDSGGDMPP